MNCPHVPEMCDEEGVRAPVVAKSIHDNRSPEGSTRPYRVSATTAGAHSYQCSEKCNHLCSGVRIPTTSFLCVALIQRLPRPLYSSVAEGEES